MLNDDTVSNSVKPQPQPTLEASLQRIVEARHHSPMSVLGSQANGSQIKITVHLPHAESVSIGKKRHHMDRIPGTDLFEWSGKSTDVEAHYKRYWTDKHGREHEDHDPYTFQPSISDYDLYLFGEGRHWHIYRILGAHEWQSDGISGIRFAVWAPNAERVSVTGDFNDWDGRVHPMQTHGSAGVWELFIPDLHSGALYKYEIRNRQHGSIQIKTDPYAQQFEKRPQTASIAVADSEYQWQDDEWTHRRRHTNQMHAPISIYEVHLGSWKRNETGQFLDYQDLAHGLVSHVKALGFTHIELLPITEHPLDASWGYQTTGYFAPTSRFGTPDDFRYFVDYCHQNNVGIILDWVPAHFPKDAHGLARFDGSALYEHEDPRKGEHRDWGTLIYNYGRNEVKNFLLASAMYWLEEFHIDGLRVDAVASMLYLDYSRQPGDWVPNVHGGNENLEAINFLKEFNDVTQGQCPGTLNFAEESTAWPLVTRPSWVGGLGFAFKWNMGWMHDTLAYMSQDPVHRLYHHDHLTFGMLYTFTENFALPFSHDEVVHGKGSLIDRMPGDEWQRFANLRLLYTYMFTYPGKKLLFMGDELAQYNEWNEEGQLDWNLLDYPNHQGIHDLVRDLNQLYSQLPELYQYDFDDKGFEWIDCHDAAQSVISYLRKSDAGIALVILNFTPVPRENYRLGVPQPGIYRERLNSDSEYYGGSNTGNGQPLESEPIPWMGRAQSLRLTLPPLAGLVLVFDQQ